MDEDSNTDPDPNQTTAEELIHIQSTRQGRHIITANLNELSPRIHADDLREISRYMAEYAVDQIGSGHKAEITWNICSFPNEPPSDSLHVSTTTDALAVIAFAAVAQNDIASGDYDSGANGTCTVKFIPSIEGGSTVWFNDQYNFSAYLDNLMPVVLSMERHGIKVILDMSRVKTWKGGLNNFVKSIYGAWRKTARDKISKNRRNMILSEERLKLPVPYANDIRFSFEYAQSEHLQAWENLRAWVNEDNKRVARANEGVINPPPFPDPERRMLNEALARRRESVRIAREDRLRRIEREEDTEQHRRMMALADRQIAARAASAAASAFLESSATSTPPPEEMEIEGSMKIKRCEKCGKRVLNLEE